jgi:hypothetical protein
LIDGFGKVEAVFLPKHANGAQPSAVEPRSRATDARNDLPTISISFHFWRRFETYQTFTGMGHAKNLFLPPSPPDEAGFVSRIPKTTIGLAVSTKA